METGDPLVFKKVKYYLMIIGNSPNVKDSDKNSYFYTLFEYSDNKSRGEKIRKMNNYVCMGKP